MLRQNAICRFRCAPSATVNATVFDSNFDNVTFSWTLILYVPQPPRGRPFGFGIGFKNSRRSPSSSPGSGITGLVVHPPGVPASPTAAPWAELLVAATAPFDHLRTMQWTLGWAVSAPFVDPVTSALPWANRTQPSDAIWAQASACGD